MSNMKSLVHPVILSGGVGTRLWPLSRALYPKQLLPLHTERSMLQETLSRVLDTGRFAPPLLICNDAHRFIVAEQTRGLDVVPQAIVLEPEGRNTAPAVAVAALMLSRTDPDAILLVLPSDHIVEHRDDFGAMIENAVPAARTGALVTFGMTPTKPETSYGYIRQGDPFNGAEACSHVERFVEKPPLDRAQEMLEDGNWFWNSGMFLFGAKAYLDELERLEPRMVELCRAAIDRGKEDLDFFRLDPDSFTALTSKSIDYAVMEHAKTAAVVPAQIGWNDIGSWSALWDVGDKDRDGNVTMGAVIAEGSKDTYVRTNGPLVATVGVRNLLVVATQDAVLVANKDQAQDVKRVVQRLENMGSQQHVSHVRVYRPWGSYQSIDSGPGFQVKQLEVKPGAKLSLQMHNQRAEHWVVVQGTARVTCGEEIFDLEVNQSTYIPIRAKHRLENPGKTPLLVIEVQSGDYLGEDDIVRFDDVYGRTET
jgi:mannose-1-phosphate guanylyltransferase / mannose-6-phosphate isomerase